MSLLYSCPKGHSSKKNGGPHLFYNPPITSEWVLCVFVTQELKVGGVSKTSENSLCDRHKNFPIWPPLWKGLELKVGGVSKTSGNSSENSSENFPIWPIRSWENWVQRWQPYLKNLDKNGGIFFWIELIFLGHPVVLIFAFRHPLSYAYNLMMF